MSKGSKSKTKGNSYELKVAKDLSKWWGGNFSRVPASGGLRWGSDHRVAGDIIPPPETRFPFVIECKKREGWEIKHVLLDNGQPRTWWEQVVMDARRVNLVPILFFSKNRDATYVMLPYTEKLYADLSSLDNNVMRTTVTFEDILGDTQIFDVVVTTYETLSKLSPDYLRDYAATLEWDNYADDYKTN